MEKDRNSLHLGIVLAAAGIAGLALAHGALACIVPSPYQTEIENAKLNIDRVVAAGFAPAIADPVGKAVAWECNGCSGTCDGSCTSGCGGGCGGCSGSCSGGCEGSCDGGCSGTCSNSCSGSCDRLTG